MSRRQRTRPTSLHTPLSAPDKTARKGFVWAGLAVLLGLLAVGGWVWTGGPSTESDTRVALGDETETTATTRDPLAGETGGTVVIDGETVNTLSPLEPLDGDADFGPTDEPDGAETTFDATPDFEPQVAAPVRSHPGIPIAELVEKSEFGPLPRIGSSGLRPLDAYAAPAQAAGAARVAVVVGGLGLSQSGTREAIERLPSSITLAFSPYGNSLNRWMTEARRAGHEVVLQLPMEPLGYPTIDPGPRTLVRAAQPGANLANLRWALGRMTNYPIVMNYLGAGMITTAQPMEGILEEIGKRGLAWFDDGTVNASVVPVLAKEKRIPNVRGTLTIDASRDDARIMASLAALEQTAKRRGFAIGTASAFPTSVSLIAEWAEKAQLSGVALVPLSALVKDYER